MRYLAVAASAFMLMSGHAYAQSVVGYESLMPAIQTIVEAGRCGLISANQGNALSALVISRWVEAYPEAPQSVMSGMINTAVVMGKAMATPVGCQVLAQQIAQEVYANSIGQ